MITINSSKQQALDAEFRAIQQINFTANLDRLGNIAIFEIFAIFHYWKSKKKLS